MSVATGERNDTAAPLTAGGVFGRTARPDHECVIKGRKVLFVIHHVDFTENLGIAYLSAVAKQLGWETDLIVYDKERADADIRRIRPAVVAYSAMSADAAVYLAINRHLKRAGDFVSIMGGPHPTYFPDVRFEEGIDFIVRGEGEPAFHELLRRIEVGEDVSAIPNLGSRDWLNPVGPLIEDLDQLPLPDRDLTFSRTEIGASALKIFMTHRGCPFRCSYCFNPALNRLQQGKGKLSRGFSPARVIAEIKAVQAKWPLTFIKFQDDLFAPRTSWLREFLPLYAREIGLPFNALERLDLVTPERLALLKQGNCRSLTFSVDSANPRIRLELLHRGMRLTNEQIASRLRLVRESGINTMVNFILGVPTSTIQDEFDAVELAVAGKVSLAITTTLVPYPGTEIYDYAVEHHLLDRPTTVAEGKRPVVQLMENQEFSSIQKRSILNCFTEKEKDVLLNISTVFSVMASLPWTRRVLYALVRRVPPNPLFVAVAILAKAYKTDRYIFTTGMPLPTKIRFLLKALRIEGKRMLGRGSTAA